MSDLLLDNLDIQGTSDWLSQRVGKFTSSRIHELSGGNDRSSHSNFINAKIELFEAIGHGGKLEVGKFKDKSPQHAKLYALLSGDVLIKKGSGKGLKLSINMDKFNDFWESLDLNELYPFFTDGSMSYIYEKTFERITGMEGDNFNGNDATEWGNEYEDEAAKEFERITGIKTTTAAFVQDRKRPYFGGSVDRYALEERAIVEIKCPYSPKNFIKASTGFVDPKYYAQNQSNMYISNLDKCYHVTYDPRMPKGCRLVYTIIERDNEFIDRLLERVDLAEEELQKLVKTIQK